LPTQKQTYIIFYPEYVGPFAIKNLSFEFELYLWESV